MDGSVSKKEATRNRLIWLSVIAQAISEAHSVSNIITRDGDRYEIQEEARRWLLFNNKDYYHVISLAGLTHEQGLALREKMEKKYGDTKRNSKRI